MTPTVKMFVIITALFIVMKTWVLIASGVRLSFGRTLAFIAWPGMRPSTFAAQRKRQEIRRPVLNGIGCILAGTALFLIARAIASRSLIAAIVIVLPAMSLILHFGVFSLAVAFWRLVGFPAEDLFRQPWRSRSVGEFWSRRWNVGFSDMMSVMVHRPIAKRFGRAAALAASFIASGLLHELAISVPAGGGFGLPTIYFLAHGGLVMAGVRGRSATLLSLLVPLPLLFHAPFVRPSSSQYCSDDEKNSERPLQRTRHGKTSIQLRALRAPDAPQQNDRERQSN